MLVAMPVGLALIVVVLCTPIGLLLSFVLKRLGFALATSSPPFVAIVVDLTGVTIYYNASLVVLRGTLF